MSKRIRQFIPVSIKFKLHSPIAEDRRHGCCKSRLACFHLLHDSSSKSATDAVADSKAKILLQSVISQSNSVSVIQ